MDEKKRPWEKYLSDRDQVVFASAGFGGKAGMGERPVLLVIDVSYAFCGDKREPILDSIKRWKLSCGEAAWNALPVIRRLIDAAQKKGLPVIYTTGYARDDKWDRGSWTWKNPEGEGSKNTPIEPQPTNRDGNDIMDEIAPRPQDIVVWKQKPSGFHEAPLQSYLQLLKADSLIVVGTTTSGCVRATTVDAFSNNYRVAVVEDACFDRADVSHAVSLLDLHAKYADVVTSEDTLAYVEGLEDGLFDVPRGS